MISYYQRQIHIFPSFQKILQKYITDIETAATQLCNRENKEKLFVDYIEQNNAEKARLMLDVGIDQQTINQQWQLLAKKYIAYGLLKKDEEKNKQMEILSLVKEKATIYLRPNMLLNLETKEITTAHVKRFFQLACPEECVPFVTFEIGFKNSDEFSLLFYDSEKIQPIDLIPVLSQIPSYTIDAIEKFYPIFRFIHDNDKKVTMNENIKNSGYLFDSVTVLYNYGNFKKNNKYCRTNYLYNIYLNHSASVPLLRLLVETCAIDLDKKIGTKQISLYERINQNTKDECYKYLQSLKTK